VAISPDGHHAIVTFLTSGVVAHLEGLGRNPDVDFVSIDPVRSTAPATERSAIQVHHRKPGSKNSAIVPANLSHPDPDPDLGRGFSRNAFAVTFVGDEVAVIAHQVSTPHLDSEGEAEVRSGGYGGGDGFTPPVSHQLVFLRLPTNGNPSARVGSETIPTHQPRALVYDPKADMLFVAGYGSDDVLALGEASQVSVHIAWERSLGRDCGPQGLAIGRDGQALVFCSLTRRIAQASPEKGLAFASGSLTESRLSKAAQRGRALFRAGGDPKISARGSLACSSCHAEGRADGLSWFLQGDRLQTPFLNGRLVGSHPFKWDGKDRDLGESLKNTVGRLGGSGISSTEANDLQAYLTSLPRPRSPHARDPQAVARGKALFDSPQTGCLRCHDGPLKSDGRRHNLARDLEEVDTPSLIGVAHSAPYYHDGSAQTLRAALKGNGSIHAMGRSAQLDDRQLGDLIAYLETL
jgi:mono/diheme cytochrome c family protein